MNGGFPAGLPTPVVRLDDVGSTNDEALRCYRDGERGPLWIVAERQTAGRGRRGREWASVSGNLFASLLLTDVAPPQSSPQLCFVAGLALHDAVAALSGLTRARIALKWPNDLLIDGAKCAGILVEGEAGSPTRPFAVVIGIGVNCLSHPAGLPYPATSLAAKGSVVSPETLIEVLELSMRQRLAEWDRGAGFDAIRRAWLSCAHGIGGAIAVRTDARTVEGLFETIDANGALVLRGTDGIRRTVSVGDVLPQQRESAP